MTRRVKYISKEGIPGSKHSMHGYILTYSRLLRENVLNGETDVRMAFLSLSHTFKIGDLSPPQEECINQSCMEFLCFLYSQLQRCYLYFTLISYARKTGEKSIKSGLDHENEVYYQQITVSTLTNADRFILAFKMSKFGYVVW